MPFTGIGDGIPSHSSSHLWEKNTKEDIIRITFESAIYKCNIKLFVPCHLYKLLAKFSKQTFH